MIAQGDATRAGADVVPAGGGLSLSVADPTSADTKFVSICNGYFVPKKIRQ